jgi:hypothetical protein
MTRDATESHNKAIRIGLVLISILFAAAALFIFLGIALGWLPEWKPQ